MNTPGVVSATQPSSRRQQRDRQPDPARRPAPRLPLGSRSSECPCACRVSPKPTAQRAPTPLQRVRRFPSLACLFVQSAFLHFPLAQSADARAQTTAHHSASSDDAVRPPSGGGDVVVHSFGGSPRTSAVTQTGDSCGRSGSLREPRGPRAGIAARRYQGTSRSSSSARRLFGSSNSRSSRLRVAGLISAYSRAKIRGKALSSYGRTPRKSRVRV